MKRFFITLMMASVMLGLSCPVVAQARGEWSVKGGIGWYSIPDFVGALMVGLGSIDTTEGTTSHSFVPLLNPNVEVHYGINDWLSLGGSLTVGYASAKSTFDDTGVLNKSIVAIYPTLCFSAQTRYFSSGKFSMYGSWGVGAMMLVGNQVTEDSTNNQFGIAPMGNAYPLCFSYGGDLGGFLEAGWGAKGLVNIGIYRNF